MKCLLFLSKFSENKNVKKGVVFLVDRHSFRSFVALLAEDFDIQL